MPIIDDLLARLPHDAPVRQVLVGTHWVVVCSRHCGMAAALTQDERHGAPAVRNAGRLLDMSAWQLAEYARSDSPLEASIGCAAINSLLEVDESTAVEINAAAVLAEKGRGKNVALVGRFPFIERLRGVVGQLWVIEQRPAPGEFSVAEGAALLAQADVAAITGSAIINGTIEGLLKQCRPGAEVMVLGPSTPLSPVLFDYGVTLISGTRVVDETAVLRTVGQGATFRQVEGVRLLTITRPARTQAAAGAQGETR